MKPAPIPHNEDARLKSLQEHQLLDTLPEEVYDDITRLASELCGTPIALLTLVDENRLWFKSKQGVDIDELPREVAFSAHAIVNPDKALVIPNTRYDERFYDSPVVTGESGIAFYAGVPVKGADGYAFGSICVMDYRPRELPEQKIESLKALAKLVNAHFELRKVKLALAEKQNDVQQIQDVVNSLQKNIAALHQGLPHAQEQHINMIQQAVNSIKQIGASAEEPGVN